MKKKTSKGGLNLLEDSENFFAEENLETLWLGISLDPAVSPSGAFLGQH